MILFDRLWGMHDRCHLSVSHYLRFVAAQFILLYLMYSYTLPISFPFALFMSDMCFEVLESQLTSNPRQMRLLKMTYFSFGGCLTIFKV
jgi:hypothetical protein